MSANTGYNFIADTLARSSQINENFEWFRGHYLPITQSSTWANTSGVMDLGSSSFHWQNGFIENLPSTASARITDLTCTTLKVTTLKVTTLQTSTWPSFSVHRNGTDQTGIVTNTITKVVWTTEIFDTNSNFASDKFTPTVAGKYLLTVGINWGTAMPDNTPQSLYIYKNGAAFKAVRHIIAGSSSDLRAQSLAIVVDANGSGDYYEIHVYHNSGSNEDLAGDTFNTWFMGCRIG